MGQLVASLGKKGFVVSIHDDSIKDLDGCGGRFLTKKTQDRNVDIDRLSIDSLVYVFFREKSGERTGVFLVHDDLELVRGSREEASTHLQTTTPRHVFLDDIRGGSTQLATRLGSDSNRGERGNDGKRKLHICIWRGVVVVVVESFLKVDFQE